MAFLPSLLLPIWKAFEKKGHKAAESLSSGFLPQTNGQTERTNQELEAALCFMSTASATCWSSRITWVEYAHNSLTSCAHGFSPFETRLGYQPPLFPTQAEDLSALAGKNHVD